MDGDMEIGGDFLFFYFLFFAFVFVFCFRALEL